MKLNLLAKIVGGFLVVVLLMIGLGVFNLFQMSALNGNMETVANNVLPSDEIISAMNMTTGNYRRQQLQHVLATTTEEMDGYESKTAVYAETMSDLFAQYQPLLANQADRDLFDKVSRAVADLHARE